MDLQQIIYYLKQINFRGLKLLSTTEYYTQASFKNANTVEVSTFQSRIVAREVSESALSIDAALPNSARVTKGGMEKGDRGIMWNHYSEHSHISLVYI